MTINELRDHIPDFARDIRLNLESVLSPEGAPGLTAEQIWGTALSCAFSLGSKELVQMIQISGTTALNDAVVEAAKSAAAIMAMNNVYYRATHLAEDEELRKLPARLRMAVIGKPGIEKRDFELMSFAISALNGCGQCLSSHLQELRKAGLSTEGIQSSLRLAAVLNAADRALKVKEAATT